MRRQPNWVWQSNHCVHTPADGVQAISMSGISCGGFSILALSYKPCLRNSYSPHLLRGDILYFNMAAVITGLPLHNGTAYNPTTAKDAVTAEAKSVSEESSSSAKAEFDLEEHPIDQPRPIKVGVIGAGLSGVTAGVLLPAKLPGLDLRIYDKNPDVVCSTVSWHSRAS